MCQFKKSFICDVCGEEINYPYFRIEWGYNQVPEFRGAEPYEFIQVCHEKCSFGILGGRNHPITFGDIIYDQLPRSAEDINTRLNELAEKNPLIAAKIADIKANIFK